MPELSGARQNRDIATAAPSQKQCLAGPLAYVAASKFVDALPLNRQSKQFARIGVELNRATLAAWMIRGGVLIQPLIN